MEGLIPKVYKSIKRSMTVRERYQSYNIKEFYPDGYNYHYPQQENKDKSQISTTRSKSTTHGHVVNNKKLVRFRSHRLLSCVTGGV
ncbi:hypothetical protein LXL04_003998 [Taraxacum kok-saghyz]